MKTNQYRLNYVTSTIQERVANFGIRRAFVLNNKELRKAMGS